MSEDFTNYMHAQCHEIEVAKWLASEKAGCDLGNEFVRDWIRDHGKEFRKK